MYSAGTDSQHPSLEAARNPSVVPSRSFQIPEAAEARDRRGLTAVGVVVGEGRDPLVGLGEWVGRVRGLLRLPRVVVGRRGCRLLVVRSNLRMDWR